MMPPPDGSFDDLVFRIDKEKRDLLEVITRSLNTDAGHAGKHIQGQQEHRRKPGEHHRVTNRLSVDRSR
jgi:hypothetical protein